jgi:hypothetical protein
MGNKSSSENSAIKAKAKAEGELKNIKNVYQQGSIILTLNGALPSGTTQIGLYSPKTAMFVPITNGGICSLLGFSMYNASADLNAPSLYITSILPGANTAVLLTFAIPSTGTVPTAEIKALTTKKNVYFAPSTTPVSTTIASILANTSNGLAANAILIGIRFGSNIPTALLNKNLTATSVPDSTAPIEAFTVGGIDIPLDNLGKYVPDKFDFSDDSGNYKMYLFLVIVIIVIFYYIYKNKQLTGEPLTLTYM